MLASDCSIKLSLGEIQRLTRGSIPGRQVGVRILCPGYRNAALCLGRNKGAGCWGRLEEVLKSCLHISQGAALSRMGCGSKTVSHHAEMITDSVAGWAGSVGQQ